MKTTMEDIRNMIKTLQIVEMVGSMAENEDEVAQNFADTFMRKVVDENMIVIDNGEWIVTDIIQKEDGRIYLHTANTSWNVEDDDDDDEWDWEDDEEDDEEEVVIDMEALKAFKDALKEFCMA